MLTRSIDSKWRSLRIRIAAVVVIPTSMLMLMSMSTDAWAQTTDPVAATELFKQGREAIASHDYVTACKKFEESARLDLKVGTLLNLADCQEHLGKIAAARQHLQRALDLATAQNDERAGIAKTRLGALDKRVPRLTVTLSESKIGGTRVLRDDVELGPGSFGSALPVEPGEHTIVVTAPHHAEKTFKITLAEAEQKTLPVDVGPAADDNAATSTSTTLPSKDATDDSNKGRGLRRTTIGYAVGGIGVAAIGTGAVFALIALNDNSKSKTTCVDNKCDQPGLDARNSARAEGNIATGFFIGGAALVAAGAVLVFTAPSDPKKSARARIAPMVSHQGVGVVLGGAF